MTFSTESAPDTELRFPVVAGRVGCLVIGPVDVDRCRECVYLVRVEEADSRRAGVASIVCSFARASHPTSHD